MVYGNLAAVYDKLMEHVDYEAWFRYVMALAKGGGCPEGPLHVLDLACGTGNFSALLERAGHRVTAIDRSGDMLAQASRKVGEKVLLLRQDMRTFRMSEPVDLALCLFDSLNYLTEEGDLAKTFNRVAKALKPGGVFLFDLHTEHKLARVLNGHTFAEAGEEVAYIWDSFYDEESRICQMDLTFFTREPEGLYRRWEETHEERFHRDEEVQKAAREAGLTVLGRYGELTEEAPGPEEERVFWLLRKD